MYWDIPVFQSVLNEMCFRFFFSNSLKAIKPLKEFIKGKNLDNQRCSYATTVPLEKNPRIYRVYRWFIGPDYSRYQILIILANNSTQQSESLMFLDNSDASLYLLKLSPQKTSGSPPTKFWSLEVLADDTSFFVYCGGLQLTGILAALWNK